MKREREWEEEEKKDMEGKRKTTSIEDVNGWSLLHGGIVRVTRWLLTLSRRPSSRMWLAFQMCGVLFLFLSCYLYILRSDYVPLLHNPVRFSLSRFRNFGSPRKCLLRIMLMDMSRIERKGVEVSNENRHVSVHPS